MVIGPLIRNCLNWRLPISYDTAQVKNLNRIKDFINNNLFLYFDNCQTLFDRTVENYGSITTVTSYRETVFINLHREPSTHIQTDPLSNLTVHRCYKPVKLLFDNCNRLQVWVKMSKFIHASDFRILETKDFWHLEKVFFSGN